MHTPREEMISSHKAVVMNMEQAGDNLLYPRRKLCKGTKCFYHGREKAEWQDIKKLPVLWKTLNTLITAASDGCSRTAVQSVSQSVSVRFVVQDPLNTKSPGSQVKSGDGFCIKKISFIALSIILTGADVTSDVTGAFISLYIYWLESQPAWLPPWKEEIFRSNV